MARVNRLGVVLVGAISALVVALVPSTAESQIRTRVRPDGTLEVFNDGAAFSLRSHPASLRPVPRADWSAWIDQRALDNGIDSRLVRAIVQVESAYDARAV